MRARLRSSHPIEAANLLGPALEQVASGLRSVADLEEHLGGFGEFSLEIWVGLSPEGELPGFATAVRDEIEAAAGDAGLLIPWSLYVARRREAGELGLGEFVERVESKQIPPLELSNAYAYCTYATTVREAFRSYPQLGRFSGLKHNQIREDFKRLDREIISLRGSARRQLRLPDQRQL